jgi:hypothetical protein
VVFENRGLRRIFGSKGNEVTGERKQLHSEVFGDLYMSPHIMRLIKPRRKSWEGRVNYWGEERGIRGYGGEF